MKSARKIKMFFKIISMPEKKSCFFQRNIVKNFLYLVDKLKFILYYNNIIFLLDYCQGFCHLYHLFHIQLIAHKKSLLPSLFLDTPLNLH